MHNPVLDRGQVIQACPEPYKRAETSKESSNSETHTVLGTLHRILYLFFLHTELTLHLALSELALCFPHPARRA